MPIFKPLTSALRQKNYAAPPLPRCPGVYIMRDAAGKVIYIGKAGNISARVAQYFKGEDSRTWKIPRLVALIRSIDYIPCSTENQALILERELIKKKQPFFNRLWKDDKSYPYVKLTMNEDFPRIFLTRKKTNDGSLYFGPYPNAGALKSLLIGLWKKKIIPLRPCKWVFSRSHSLSRHKIASCVYFHTGQCPAPCGGKITHGDYRDIAIRARLFFQGKLARLKKEFSEAMRLAASEMRYEEAAVCRNSLEAIDSIAERILIREINPGKIADSAKDSETMSDLKDMLGLPRLPVHIEAFDTSNISGKNPVGSMVCFLGTEPQKSHYRKFRIRTGLPEGGGDDYAMMREIVRRRLSGLKRSGGNFPDLILIDGGAGQLSSALRALNEAGVSVPVISLAKKNEEIYIPGKAPLRPPRDSNALRLLQKIRDEAHRFAISYHRHVRQKKLLED